MSSGIVTLKATRSVPSNLEVYNHLSLKTLLFLSWIHMLCDNLFAGNFTVIIIHCIDAVLTGNP